MQFALPTPFNLGALPCNNSPPTLKEECEQSEKHDESTRPSRLKGNTAVGAYTGSPALLGNGINGMTGR